MIVITRILVPFDFGEPSTNALDYAKDLAVRFDASLDLLHVVTNPTVPESIDMYIPVLPDLLDGAVKSATARLDRVLPVEDRPRFRARCLVKVGDPRTEIIGHAQAEKVDLIAMGTHGRTGLSHLLLGSVAERIVRAAPCPVLTVR